MIEQVDINCSICKKHNFAFPSNPLNSIVAISGYWFTSIETRDYLFSIPEANNKYVLSLRAPIKLKLNDVIWIYFENAQSVYNGIESVEDIQSIRFCKCRVEQLFNVSDTSVDIQVYVLDCIPLAQLKNWQACEYPFNDFIENLLIQNTERNSIQKIDQYSLLNLNIQSDLGITIILELGKEYSTILCVNEWNFHENFFYGGNFKVNTNYLEKYGI